MPIDSPSPTAPSPVRPRVVHFVTGGFSGATQVAVDLCLAGMAQGRFEPVLVLRRKRNTSDERVQALRRQGLEVHVVSGLAHILTVVQLALLLRRLRPALLLAHGYPEHLLGRHAGWWACVPHLIQVEHNSRERYSAWSLWQARWLSRRSSALIGVSEGVRRVMVRLGMPEELTRAIPNGIDLTPFSVAPEGPFEARERVVLMSARFARQKDHPTLIRALAALLDRGVVLPLRLAGRGKPSLERHVRRLVHDCDLSDQVEWLGQVDDLPQRLMRTRFFVLATHWEGMPLALVEAMAAGCACVASAVGGVEGVIEHERTGLLVPEGDAQALADALQRLLTEPCLAARLGAAAREQAFASHGKTLMLQRYEALMADLQARSQ